MPHSCVNCEFEDDCICCPKCSSHQCVECDACWTCDPTSYCKQCDDCMCCCAACPNCHEHCCICVDDANGHDYFAELALTATTLPTTAEGRAAFWPQLAENYPGVAQNVLRLALNHDQLALALAMRLVCKDWYRAVSHYFNWFRHHRSRLELRFDASPKVELFREYPKADLWKPRCLNNFINEVLLHNIHADSLVSKEEDAEWLIHQHLFRCGVFSDDNSYTLFRFVPATDQSFRSLIIAAVHHHGVQKIVSMISKFTLIIKIHTRRAITYDIRIESNKFVATLPARDDVINLVKSGNINGEAAASKWCNAHFEEAVKHPLGVRLASHMHKHFVKHFPAKDYFNSVLSKIPSSLWSSIGFRALHTVSERPKYLKAFCRNHSYSWYLCGRQGDIKGYFEFVVSLPAHLRHHALSNLYWPRAFFVDERPEFLLVILENIFEHDFDNYFNYLEAMPSKTLAQYVPKKHFYTALQFWLKHDPNGNYHRLANLIKFKGSRAAPSVVPTGDPFAKIRQRYEAPPSMANDGLEERETKKIKI